MIQHNTERVNDEELIETINNAERLIQSMRNAIGKYMVITIFLIVGLTWIGSLLLATIETISPTSYWWRFPFYVTWGTLYLIPLLTTINMFETGGKISTLEKNLKYIKEQKELRDVKIKN